MQATLSDTLNPAVRAALTDAVAALHDLYGARLLRLVLYGSQVRGEAHDESDVDVLDGEVNVLKELRRLSLLSMRLLVKHGESVSFQPYAEADYTAGQRRFLRTVHAEGVVL